MGVLDARSNRGVRALTVTVSQAAVNAWARDLAGPVARELTKAAKTIVVPDAKKALSVPRPPIHVRRQIASANRQTALIGDHGPHTHITENPPPGPPHRRTGDMRKSVRALRPRVGAEGIHVLVIADALARHDGFMYPEHLLNQGYEFLPKKYY